MTIDRRIAGRRAKKAGDDFEAFVEKHHQEALRLGILAHIVHNGPTAEMMHGRWEMVAAGVSDYTGTLYNGVGTTIAVEAKSYRKRLPKNEISVKQQQHLDAVVRGGGLAFLFVRIIEEDETAEFVSEYAVPWQLVPWKVKRTAESVDAAALAPWVIPSDCACYLDKYCPVRGVPVAGIAGGQKPRFPRE